MEVNPVPKKTIEDGSYKKSGNVRTTNIPQQIPATEAEKPNESTNNAAGE